MPGKLRAVDIVVGFVNSITGAALAMSVGAVILEAADVLGIRPRRPLVLLVFAGVFGVAGAVVALRSSMPPAGSHDENRKADFLRRAGVALAERRLARDRRAEPDSPGFQHSAASERRGDPVG